MNVAIYTRISSDPDGTSTATERQEADARKLCEAHGWDTIEVYRDSDVSAYKRRVRRPQFERLLVDLSAGAVDRVVVWKTDRLARQPRDLERFLDACEANRGELLSVTEPQFAGTTGLLMLRIVIAFANNESSVKAQRVARARQEKAEKGGWPGGGRRTFGYTHAGEVVPDEAELVREAVGRTLGGDAVHRVSSDWSERGVTTTAGHPWRSGNLRRYLQSPRIAGLSEYRGEVIGDGAWEALVEPERWRQLQTVIAASSQRHSSPTKHLLSGLLICERCGTPMRGNAARGRYVCPEGGCGRTVIAIGAAEHEVSERVLHRLTPETLDSLVSHDPAGELLVDLRQDEGQLERLAEDHYVEGVIDRASFLRAQRGLKRRIEANRRKLAQGSSKAALVPRGEELRAVWERRGVRWRRSLLEVALHRVVVKGGRPGRRFDPDRVSCEWRV